VGAAILERYLVEDLMGGQIAHCYGHHYSTPDLRLAFHYALAEVSATPGSMVYGNTTSYRGTAAENYASLAGYLSVDIAAQRIRPTGHAINPVPVTENERIPDIDEIVDAQLFSARMIEVTENHFQFAGDDVSDTAKTLVEGGKLFFDNLLKGFAEAGIDIQNPVEMFLAIRRIGGKKLEVWYGPGKLESGRERRVPQVASDTVRELNTATERILKELEHYGLEKLVNNNLRIVVATTDVHEHSKMLLERLFSRIGIEVIDGGVSVDPRDLAQTAERNDAHAIALSTYNGVALTYYGMLRDELIEMGMGIPVLVGGQLNEIPQDSEDSLPVDVGEELEELGAVVCRTIPDAMPWLIELTEVHHEAGMKA